MAEPLPETYYTRNRFIFYIPGLGVILTLAVVFATGVQATLTPTSGFFLVAPRADVVELIYECGYRAEIYRVNGSGFSRDGPAALLSEQAAHCN